jgi:stage II sporulation protein D
VIRRFLFLIFVSALVAGCAGPKRLPPVDPSIPADGSGENSPGYPIMLDVGLAENKPTLNLQATGKCLVLDGSDGSRLGFFSGGKAQMVCQKEKGKIGVQWDRVRGQVPSIILQPVKSGTHVLYDGREYKGAFEVILTPQGDGLTLINKIELETYLRGVLPWEIGRPGPDAQAALEAQAVAARTYTVSRLGSRSARGFDVVATIMDQVYRGCKDEDTQCNLAIDATRGVVLQHEGKEISAFYSSCCGGVNSQIEEVWPRSPVAYLRSHLDAASKSTTAFCSQSRHFRWQETWDVAELESILQSTLPAYMKYMEDSMRKKWAGTLYVPRDQTSSPLQPGKLLDLDIRKRTSSGRVALLAITTTSGTYEVRGDRVRWVLPPPLGGKYSILRSAFFDVNLQRNGNSLTSITISGRGNGHGLGMCQTGALEMARQGYSFENILRHYYNGATLADLRQTGAAHGR